MHQYLFYIGDFPIRMYGLVLCMSIFLATGVAYFLAKQDGRWHQHVLDIGIYGGFAGLIGARLWDVFFFDWDYYQHHLLEIPFVWQGGMAVQGGIIAGVLTGIWYCKRHNIDWVAFADIVTPSILIGQAVGRMANLLNGDAFGTPTGGNFGILYPVGTLAHKTLACGSLGRPAGRCHFCPFINLPRLRPRQRAGYVPLCYAVFRRALWAGNAARRLRGAVPVRLKIGAGNKLDILFNCACRLYLLRREG